MKRVPSCRTLSRTNAREEARGQKQAGGSPGRTAKSRDATDRRLLLQLRVAKAVASIGLCSMSTWEQAESIAFFTTDLPPNDTGVLRRDKIPSETELSMLTGAAYNPEIPKEIAFRHTIFDPERHLPKDDVRLTMQQLQVFPLAMLKNRTTRPLELAMFRVQGEGPLVVPPFDPNGPYAKAKGMLPFSWQRQDDFLSSRRTPTSADTRQPSERTLERESPRFEHKLANRAQVTKKRAKPRPPLNLGNLGKAEPTNFEKKAMKEKKQLEEAIRLRRRLRLLDSHLENMPDEAKVFKKTDYSKIGKLEVQPWRSGGSIAPEFQRRATDYKIAHDQVPPDPKMFRGFLDRTYVPAMVTDHKR